MLEDIRQRLLQYYQRYGKQKIVVAMSGGVDSSTVAALLNDAGHDVIGITLQLYSTNYEIETLGTCCAGKDIYDAQTAANKIGIPHYVFNYESNFKTEVIDKFVNSYLIGETPIPCILCNQKIKFKDLLNATRNLSANKMATGHYVRKVEISNKIENVQLHQGIDITKDQSYFLFNTTYEQLKMLEFPLGSITKPITRELANYYGLNIANKKDSQDICFVPNGDYRKVIYDLQPNAKQSGNIIMNNGTILGKHNGIINYTIGQRRGLGISYTEPLYVIKIDAQKNEVILGTKNELLGRTFKIKNINWLSQNYTESFECKVKLRSSHSGSIATVRLIDNSNDAYIELYDGYPGITPGQACVMYNHTQVIGGGWIVNE